MPLIAWVGVALVGGYLMSALAMKKPAPPPQTTLDDFEIPQIEEGTPQAVIFGDVWLEGWQVLWYGNYRTTKIPAQGGKK